MFIIIDLIIFYKLQKYYKHDHKEIHEIKEIN